MNARTNWIAAGHADPILYMPFDDDTNWAKNEGTGGTLTQNGVIARSGRGANQFNVPYSDLDGAADYLSRTSAPTGIADGKQFTFQCVVNSDVTSNQDIIAFGDASSPRFTVTLGSTLLISGFNSSGSNRLSASITGNPLVSGRNYILTVSIDMSDTAKRHVYLNGVSQTVTWSTYTNEALGFNITGTPRYRVGASVDTTPSSYFNGRLGNVFFHTSYIDLSVPANLAKFVTGTGIDAEAADLGADGSTPLGVQPLIYLPMYGNNAGKNYGSGGDFTVNSGPYTGSRGPNEFWGNKADFDGSTGYLYRNSAVSALTSASGVSISFAANPVNFSGQRQILALATSGSSTVVQVVLENSTGKIILEIPNTGGSIFKKSDTILTSGTTNYIQISVNTSTGAVYGYKNGVNFTWSDVGGQGTGTYNPSTATKNRIGVDVYGTSLMLGSISELYFTTDYIDFSQEANRLKFRDCFGNPVPLGTDGSLPTGTAPAIYMRFDPAAQGTNSGTGGAFTKSGTISDGGQL